MDDWDVLSSVVGGGELKRAINRAPWLGLGLLLGLGGWRGGVGYGTDR